jgi:hypothetical protein
LATVGGEEPRDAPSVFPFASLEARRVDLPRVATGSCPFNAGLKLDGVPGEAALGPGSPDERGLERLEKGPVYAAFPGTPRILDVFPPASGGSSYEGDVLWVIRPSYDGPILVRGRQVDGQHKIGFGVGRDPQSGLRIEATSAASTDQAPRNAFDHDIRTPPGWRVVASALRIQMPAREIRCYGAQIDGNGFSYPIVFGAIPQPGGA